MACVFCEQSGGEVLWSNELCRAVWAHEPDHPGLCRVIWEQHVKEMSDLSVAHRAELMRVVFGLEQALIDVLAPAKMNLASLGNQVPHLHWHVIPRFHDDPHFPSPIWAAKVREGAHPLPANFATTLRAGLDRLL